jgi:ribose 1,5-bisphosphokinase
VANALSEEANLKTVSKTGTLVLIVGPSGAGKDSIIDGARRILRNDPRFVFPRRVITRPVDETEDHAECSREDFDVLKNTSSLSLHWQAHGLYYGIPAGIENEIAGGRIVITNVSRSIIGQAHERFPHVCTVTIDAPVEMRSKRLHERDREDNASIDARLNRQVNNPDPRETDYTILNDGNLSDAIESFVTILKSIASHT